MNSSFQSLTQQSVDVVVIGGGATGTGIARDAALRGFSVALVERGELGSGTSGHFHGSLHSGARYAVDDPVTALECYSENQILQRIGGSAIHRTGGLFLALSEEEAAHGDVLVRACRQVGITIDEISIEKALQQEPRVNHALTRAFTVPDGYVDGAELLRLNRQAAEEASVPAVFLTRHAVTDFHKSDGQVDAVIVQDMQTGTQRTIECRFVINAAGVWAGRVSQLIGASIDLVLDKGTMIVIEGNLHNAVLNRCRPQSDGDIFVPTGHSTIVGTTSCVTTDIDNPQPTPEEIDILLREGDLLLPGLAKLPVKTAFAGVRPLFGKADDPQMLHGRKLSRSFQVIDHQHDTGAANFLSVVGGKVTVYRRMAEAAVDKMCEKLGEQRACQTAEIALAAQPSQPSKPLAATTA